MYFIIIIVIIIIIQYTTTVNSEYKSAEALIHETAMTTSLGWFSVHCSKIILAHSSCYTRIVGSGPETSQFTLTWPQPVCQTMDVAKGNFLHIYNSTSSDSLYARYTLSPTARLSSAPVGLNIICCYYSLMRSVSIRN